MTANPASPGVGKRLRRLREIKGLSRTQLARKLGVDVSSISGWEGGKRLPRDAVRARLAHILDCELASLLSELDDDFPPFSAEILDTMTVFPKALLDCTRNARHSLRGARLAAPYTTCANVQTEWRTLLAERILAGTLEVQRVEIFYGLDRLKETLSNIVHYEGKAYHVKSYCAGLKDVAPFMGGYVFDDTDFFFGGYWTGVPPQDRPTLRLKGRYLATFYMPYWAEIWGRGALLNIRGSHDLSAVRELALAMGLPPRRWKSFVEEARCYEVGDGAPPLF